MHQENSGREIESFKWAKKIGKRENSLNIFFVGTIGKSFNFDPILKAARYFSKKQIEINFLICGDGELKSDIERRSSSLKNIFFTGWINRSEINVLSNICHLSIAPYINSATFKNTVSNKMIDYLSLGLPIITSIDGRGAQYLKKNNTAMIYDENDYKTLISKIERFFYDKRNVSEMRLASLNLYKNIYSYEIVYENAYKKILDLKDS
jgi:glycosyltransferase involved in cell wall biosynthesis